MGVVILAGEEVQEGRGEDGQGFIVKEIGGCLASLGIVAHFNSSLSCWAISLKKSKKKKATTTIYI